MPTATATRTVTITDMIALDDRLGPIHFFEMETKDDEGFAVFHSNVVISTTNPVALGSDLRRLASELPAASTLSAAVDETVSGVNVDLDSFDYLVTFSTVELVNDRA